MPSVTGLPSSLDPYRSPFGRHRVPLPTGAEAAAFDRRAIQELGVPEPVLMENAGREAARVIEALAPPGRVTVLAGAGNNGGDGLVLARTLTAWGREVEVLVLGERPVPDPLLHGWEPVVTHLTGSAEEAAGKLRGAALVVDALLGTGIRGAPREPQARVIAELNRCRAPIVALDVPSGVNADDGSVAGEAVRAGLTIAFGAPKRGTLRHPGRSRSGRLIAVDIGFPPWSDRDSSAFLVTPGWAAFERPRRGADVHKNRAGRLLLLVGSAAFGGAAVLTARSALRAGVGFLRVAVPSELRSLLQAAAPEAVCVDAGDGEELRRAVQASDAVAAGPGLGTDGVAAERLTRVLGEASGRPVALDADALNLLAADTVSVSGRDAGTLLTPHPGEAARLVGASPGEIVAAPEASARRIAGTFGGAVLLKGAPSLVAPPEEGAPILVASGGSSDLARAGMGDVLTGVAGAFLARGVAPVEAAGLALHFTSRAADIAGAGEALLPTDVVEFLPRALGAVSGAGPGAGEAEAERSPLGIPSILLDLPPAR